MSIFFIFISFFDEICVSKQNSPRWDVPPGTILFACDAVNLSNSYAMLDNAFYTDHSFHASLLPLWAMQIKHKCVIYDQ